MTSIIFGSMMTASVYVGRMGQRYNMCNHFVSELGEIGVSQLAWLFNAMLILGGVCITLFMLGTALEFRNWFSYVLGLCGSITGISAVLVGIYPMNNLQPHIKVAMLFFNMGLITISLISLYIALAKRCPFPKWFVIPGVFGTLCFAMFLSIPTPPNTTEPALALSARLLEHRPQIWTLAVMEWLVVIVVLAWVVMISLYFLQSVLQKSR